MSTEKLTEDDVGKDVVNTNGATVGIVVSVEDGVAHVDVDPNITDTVKAKLGLNDVSGQTFPLNPGDVSASTDDELRVTDISGADGQ
jgi:hypothetical protein